LHQPLDALLDRLAGRHHDLAPVEGFRGQREPSPWSTLFVSSLPPKGIGPVYARKLADRFEEQIFDVIEQRLPKPVTTLPYGCLRERAGWLRSNWAVSGRRWAMEWVVTTTHLATRSGRWRFRRPHRCRRGAAHFNTLGTGRVRWKHVGENAVGIVELGAFVLAGPGIPTGVLIGEIPNSGLVRSGVPCPCCL